MFKNLLRLSGLCLAVFGFSISAQAASPVNTTTFYHLAVDGYDVVAYQTDRKAIKRQLDFCTAWRAATWQFASAAHLKQFSADPQCYAPQSGAYSASALATNAPLEIGRAHV